MAASSLTPTILLPQFEESDKPSWLGDFNQAMKKIDNAITVRDLTINNLTAQVNALAARVTVLEAGA